MSGVVLRCPNCGTTRDAPGECDACHEAEVRYYCTNHAQGRWLEQRVCPQCGAKYGDPLPVPPRPHPSRAPETIASPMTRNRVEPALRRRTAGVPIWRRRRVSPPPKDIDRDEPPDGISRRGPWTPEERWEERASPEPAVLIGPSMVGCLRFALILVLLFLLVGLGLPLLLGGVVFYSF
jgi:predicted RNA-binding Zn-ribbon protein involved in translation (DUF1610 family)